MMELGVSHTSGTHPYLLFLVRLGRLEDEFTLDQKKGRYRFLTCSSRFFDNDHINIPSDFTEHLKLILCETFLWNFKFTFTEF
jgi:hypothetical protein